MNGGSTRAVTPQGHFVRIPVERADVFLDPAQRLHDVFQTVVTWAGSAARAQESWMRIQNYRMKKFGKICLEFWRETGACWRICLIELEGVEVEESSIWMSKKLEVL